MRPIEPWPMACIYLFCETFVEKGTSFSLRKRMKALSCVSGMVFPFLPLCALTCLYLAYGR